MPSAREWSGVPGVPAQELRPEANKQFKIGTERLSSFGAAARQPTTLPSWFVQCCEPHGGCDAFILHRRSITPQQIDETEHRRNAYQEAGHPQIRQHAPWYLDGLTHASVCCGVVGGSKRLAYRVCAQGFVLWADGLLAAVWPCPTAPKHPSHRWPDSAQYKEASSVPPAVGQSRELILCETQPPSHTRRPDPAKPKPAGAVHSPSTFPARHTTHLGLRGTQRPTPKPHRDPASPPGRHKTNPVPNLVSHLRTQPTPELSELLNPNAPSECARRPFAVLTSWPGLS